MSSTSEQTSPTGIEQGSPAGDRSAAQLVNDLAAQTGQLVRQELALARAEMTQKGQRAGIGIGLFGGAGVFALYGVGALTAAGILLLATAVKAWIAAVIVAGALFLVAAVASLIGKREVSQAVPPVPEKTIETSREDIDTVRESAREGRNR